MTGRKGPRPIPVITRVPELPAETREPYPLGESRRGQPLIPPICKPGIGLVLYWSLLMALPSTLEPARHIGLAVLISVVLVALGLTILNRFSGRTQPEASDQEA